MPKAKTQVPRRGRPRKSDARQRKEDFLDYCLGQFMTLGYSNATIRDLARGAGAGKSTIYEWFGSKAGLVHAVMARGVPMLQEPLEAVCTCPTRSPREVLYDYGAVLQAYSCDPSVRAIYRCVSEAREELGETLEREIRALRDQVITPVTRYLADLDQAGRLSIKDPAFAATWFSEVTGGGIGTYLGGPLPQRDRARALELAVDMMLNGFLPRIA